MWALTYTRPCDTMPPTSLIHSAAHLFQSVTAILKPNLWEHEAFRELLCVGNYSCFKSDTVKVLRRALVNGIVLAGGDAAARQRLMSMNFVIQFSVDSATF